jgi:hypothetical protein
MATSSIVYPSHQTGSVSFSNKDTTSFRFVSPISSNSSPSLSERPTLVAAMRSNGRHTSKRDCNGSECSSDVGSSSGVHYNTSNPLNPLEQTSYGSDSIASVCPTTPKKCRTNGYIAPRTVAKSFNSEIGSLAVTQNQQLQLNQQPQQYQFGQGNLRPHLRRQLSGSKIEAYLSIGGDHQDSMDVDGEGSRPRSMSF